jgi:NAD(P)H-hydrate epimerase
MSQETKSNYSSLKKITEKLFHIKSENDFTYINSDCDIIIDSMIGVGGSENIKGITAIILKKINSINAIKFAIDVPTGLNSESGKAYKYCFKANYTITMYAKKLGLLLGQGPEYSGEIIVADLGSPIQIVKDKSQIIHHTKEDLAQLLPNRNKISSKFDYGRVVILAGSKQFPGAGALTANAAIKTGAGLVELFTEYLHPSTLPEVICPVFSKDEPRDFDLFFEAFLKSAERSNSIVIGPGLGETFDWNKLSKFIYSLNDNKSLLIDADGIRAVDVNRQFNSKVILTPHLGEFSRLIGVPRNEIENNPLNFAKKYADQMECIIHLKSVPSITTDGDYSALTTNGNPGMSTAGSGDVLSGIISSLVAQGLSTFDSASLGAFIHAGAASMFTSKFREQSLTASDIVEFIKYFMINEND